jgi:hypothetical protein
MDCCTIHSYSETARRIVTEVVIHLYNSILVLYEAMCEFIRDRGYEKAYYQHLAKEYDRRVTKYGRRQRGFAAIAETQRTISKESVYTQCSMQETRYPRRAQVQGSELLLVVD